MAIFFIPHCAWAWRAAMAALAKKQKPIAFARSAWCPGGRQAENAERAQPSITESTAWTAPPAERSAATAGCVLRWRAGHSETTLTVITVPYGNRVMLQDYCDWMEHKGLWGSRKVTVKRSTSKSLLSLTGSVYGYEGVGLLFITRFDPKKRGELQGFDLKVE